MSKKKRSLHPVYYWSYFLADGALFDIRRTILFWRGKTYFLWQSLFQLEKISRNTVKSWTTFQEINSQIQPPLKLARGYCRSRRRGIFHVKGRRGRIGYFPGRFWERGKGILLERVTKQESTRRRKSVPASSSTRIDKTKNFIKTPLWCTLLFTTNVPPPKKTNWNFYTLSWKLFLLLLWGNSTPIQDPKEVRKFKE